MKKKLTDLVATNIPKLLWLLVILAFLLSLPFLFKPMIGEWDAYQRSMMTTEMFLNGHLFLGETGPWIPFYFSLMSLSLYLYPDAMITLRVVTVLFSLMTIFPLYGLCQITLKKKEVSILAVIIYILLPLRIITSVQTLSEPVFIFFFTSSIYFVARKNTQLLASALLMSMALGIRYEAWYFLPFYWIFLWIREKKISKRLVKSMAITLIMPLLWISINYWQEASPLSFFLYKYDRAKEYPLSSYWNFPDALREWCSNLISYFSLSLTLATVYGIKVFLDKKRDEVAHLLIVSSGYLFLILPIQVFFGTMESLSGRYLLLPIMLWLPFTAYGVLLVKVRLVSHVQKHQVLIWPYVLILGTVFFFSYWSLALNSYLISVQPTQSHQQDLFEMTDWINQDADISVVYMYQPAERLWLEAPTRYFSQRFQLASIEQNSVNFDNLADGVYIVAERVPEPQDPEFPTNYQLLFQNPSFAVLKKVISEF